MFLYKDSKLEADIKQLNSNINKTEYEKAREPLQKQIAILNKKLYEKDIALQSLYQVCKEFLHNNIKNRQIIVMKNEPHLFYGAVSDLEFEKLETIKIDLSDYKRVLKENEELKNKLSLKQFDINIVYNDYLEKLYKYEQNSIPIQKIKDKIKKNKNLVEESNDGDIIRKLNQENEVLQDLLEEEKQWEKYIKAGN